MLVQDTRSFSRLIGDQQAAGGFGALPGRIGMHGYAGKEGQFAGGFGKGGNVGAEAHQRFLKPRGQVAGQQAEFLIEGGKARLHRPGSLRTGVPR
jgi:hypothetical protein